MEAGVSHTTLVRWRGPLHYINSIAEKVGWDVVEPLLHGRIGREYWQHLSALSIFQRKATFRKLLIELAKMPKRKERHSRILAAMQSYNEKALQGLEHFRRRQEEQERYPEALLRFIDEGP